jgi:hypothetical protein
MLGQIKCEENFVAIERIIAIGSAVAAWVRRFRMPMLKLVNFIPFFIEGQL